MTFTALVRAAVLSAILGTGAIATASAQTSTAPMSTPGQSAQPTQPGMPGTMGGMAHGGAGMSGMSEMMGRMMGGMSHGMMGNGFRMRVMFAIADTNGDGALSFDEVTAIHKRIFDAIDANKDGKVTPEELQRFLQGP